MRYEIDTTKLLKQFVHYAWVMILAFAVGAAGGYVYTENIEPDSYDARISLVVNSRQDEYSDVGEAMRIIKTAVALMNSETFINDNIVERGGIDKPVSEIEDMATFSIEEETLIAYIRITAASPELAYDIANAFYNADYSYIDTKVDCSISTVDPPTLPEAANAKNSKNIGFMAGLVCAVLVALVITGITVFDTCIRTEDDLMSIRGDVPIVGVIPSFDQPNSGYGYASKYRSAEKNERGSKK